MAKVPKGFRAVKKVGGKVVAIKIKRNQRLKISGQKGKTKRVGSDTWKKTYRRLLKAEHEAYPTPENFSRRDWQKLHKLPRAIDGSRQFSTTATCR